MKDRNFDLVDMIMAILGGLYNIGLVVGCVTLCIHFNNLWAIVMLVFGASFKYKSKFDKEKEDI